MLKSLITVITTPETIQEKFSMHYVWNTYFNVQPHSQNVKYVPNGAKLEFGLCFPMICHDLSTKYAAWYYFCGSSPWYIEEFK